MYKLLFMCFSIFSMMFVACSDSSGSKDSKQAIRVGINAGYPPFEFKKDAKIVGFDIDLLDALSKKVGFEYTLHDMSFDGLILALKANKIDMVISSMSATDERRKKADFSDPYYEGKTLYLKRADDTSIVDKDSIKNKKVGVFIGTIQEQQMKNLADSYNIAVVSSDSIFGAIMNLKEKKVDFVAADAATSIGYLKENSDLAGFYEEPDGSEGLSIAVDKHKHKELLENINKALKELKDSGEYDKILEKWDLK